MQGLFPPPLSLPALAFDPGVCGSGVEVFGSRIVWRPTAAGATVAAMIVPEETAAGFVAQALGKDDLGLSPAAQTELREDARGLGLFGLLAALALPDGAAPDPAVRDELTGALTRDLGDALAGEGEAAQDGLEALFARYRAAKGERGPALLGRLIARVIHEVYDLQAHRLAQDDALNAACLLAHGGPEQDAREAVRRIVRLSRRAARHAMGHLSEQLAFVHELGQLEGELPLAELDRRIGEYAPRLFAQRLPSLTRSLIPDEPRFRFAFVLWGRLRGLVLPKSGLMALAEEVVPEQPGRLAAALAAAAPARATLRGADAAAPAARAIEAAFRAPGVTA